MMANHSDCRENISWADKRVSGIRREIYRVLCRYKYDNVYGGEVDSEILYRHYQALIQEAGLQVKQMLQRLS